MKLFLAKYAVVVGTAAVVGMVLVGDFPGRYKLVEYLERKKEEAA